MKIQNFHKHKKFFTVFLIQSVFIITAFISAGCYNDKKSSPSAADMIVVFRIDVPVEKASSILFEKEYIFIEGMDRSKDKKYFRETGPKFIVKVPKDKIEIFNLEFKNIPQVFEVYQADWTVSKD